MGLSRPDVLAHDFGRATALRACFRNGLRYASLTLFDAVALAPWGSPFVQHVRQYEAAFAGMPEYMHSALLATWPITGATRAIFCSVWKASWMRNWMTVAPSRCGLA